MEGYLRRRPAYTLLPSLRPHDSSSTVNVEWYGDTESQDQLAIMDACLHDLYDVHRAETIFENLRASKANTLLEVRIYNAFLEAYLQMAQREPQTAEVWLGKMWDLYGALESGKAHLAPTASTYALMILSLLRYAIALLDSSTPPELQSLCPFTYKELLSRITVREYDIKRVVSDRVISNEDGPQLIKELSRAAVQLNLPTLVAELGETHAMATVQPDILDTIPEVRPVLKDKSEDGTVETTTKEIPFNLDNLRRHLSQINFARRVLPDDLAARQKLLEESVYDVAVERLEHEAAVLNSIGVGSSFGRDIRQWMWDWHTKLKVRLEEEVKNIQKLEALPAKKGKKTRSNDLSQYLVLVRPERLSLITIMEIMRLQGSGGVSQGMKTTRALVGIGRAIEAEYKAQMCKKNNIALPPLKHSAEPGYFSGLGYTNLLERRVVAARHIMDSEAWTSNWTQVTRSQVGGLVIDCLMDVAKVVRTAMDKNTGEVISEEQPAFYHTYEHQRGQKLGVIRFNQVLAEAMAKDNLRTTLHPRHLPMLVPPRPWVGPESGGYYYNKSSAMRYKESVEQASYLRHASDMGNVELIYAGLDVLGSTPWVINQKIFDVVLEVWNSGEGLGKLPPAVYPSPEPILPPDASPKEKALYLYKLKAHSQEKANNHSKRCNVNYKIEIARSLLGDKLFQPHNLDFRGRAYPIPPHLNHIGDDLSRGLLKFAERKPLGERGLRWLKIHLANLYGYDKANFDERVQFVEERLDEIFDSATEPLTGRGWWQKADDPWQCLATCFELHEALTSPDPLAYASSQPVHQDGTCNGLQHYAALGGDSRGAQQVNLAAGERPSDVYTYVANMVESQILKDVELGNPAAAMLQNKVSRKVVKQTVMTTVYGVTYIGAREQIEKQIRAIEEFKDSDSWMLSSYLAKSVLGCIGDLFSGAKDIQNWLTLSARLIARAIPEERLPEALDEFNRSKQVKTEYLPVDKLKKEQLTSVVWTTPLGLPIVQPYRKTKRKQVMTKVQTVYISDPNMASEVNSMKQASAFPPNFIHSLDATHMMLSALECQTQGLTFAAVHDSYWTHACNIDQMSTIIRDTFIALHSSDVLGKLREEFVERYKNYKIPLIDMKSVSLIKALKTSGVQMRVSKKQAEELSLLESILVIDDKKTAVTEVETTEEDKQQMLQEVRGLEDFDEEFDVDAESLDKEAAAELAKMEKKKDQAKAQLKLLGKFVTLTDILPPVPKKGDFRVEAIKASQYFFS
ncbi:DNA/RNA polymerase [Mucidula mucida]|nr:DNA/RNA polymerase [Mucidula mucida]